MATLTARRSRAGSTAAERFSDWPSHQLFPGLRRPADVWSSLGLPSRTDCIEWSTSRRLKLRAGSRYHPILGPPPIPFRSPTISHLPQFVFTESNCCPEGPDRSRRRRIVLE